MSSIYEEYAILKAMIEFYLLNEYSSNAWIITSVESYEYFKNYANQKKNLTLPKQIHTPSLQMTKISPLPSQVNSVQKTSDERLITSNKSESFSQPHPVKNEDPSLKGGDCLNPNFEGVSNSLLNAELKDPSLKAWVSPNLKKEKNDTEKHSSKHFELNPLGTAVGINLTDIRKRFVENFPGHPVLETISAEKMKNNEDSSLKGGDCLNQNLEGVSNSLQNTELKNPGLKAGVPPNLIKVLVVAFDEESTHLTFLNNLSKAINNSLCSAMLVQSYDIKPILEASELRILIAQEKELFADAYLSQKIKKLLQKNVEIIFISPIEDYLSTPKLKAQLWHKIKNLCRAASSKQSE